MVTLNLATSSIYTPFRKSNSARCLQENSERKCGKASIPTCARSVTNVSKDGGKKLETVFESQIFQRKTDVLFHVLSDTRRLSVFKFPQTLAQNVCTIFAQVMQDYRHEIDFLCSLEFESCLLTNRSRACGGVSFAHTFYRKGCVFLQRRQEVAFFASSSSAVKDIGTISLKICLISASSFLIVSINFEVASVSSVNHDDFVYLGSTKTTLYPNPHTS